MANEIKRRSLFGWLAGGAAVASATPLKVPQMPVADPDMQSMTSNGKEWSIRWHGWMPHAASQQLMGRYTAHCKELGHWVYSGFPGGFGLFTLGATFDCSIKSWQQELCDRINYAKHHGDRLAVGRLVMLGKRESFAILMQYLHAASGVAKEELGIFDGMVCGPNNDVWLSLTTPDYVKAFHYTALAPHMFPQFEPVYEPILIKDRFHQNQWAAEAKVIAKIQALYA